MARETYTLEEQPTYQEAVEKLLDSDPVKAEGSFLETLLLRILNNIKAAYQKAVQAENGIGTAQSSLDAHINNKSNPHGVTAGQTGALPLSGGTMTGSLKAMSSPAVGTAQARNIYAGTSDMTAGSSTLATGTIYLVYE